MASSSIAHVWAKIKEVTLKVIRTTEIATRAALALINKEPLATVGTRTLASALIMYQIMKIRKRYKRGTAKHRDAHDHERGPGGGNPPAPPPPPPLPEPQSTIPGPQDEDEDDDFDSYDEVGKKQWIMRHYDFACNLTRVNPRRMSVFERKVMSFVRYIAAKEKAKDARLLQQLGDPNATDTDKNLDADVVGRVSSENKARDTLISTASSDLGQHGITPTTPSDLDFGEALQENELQELLNSVTQDISNADKSRLEQDDFGEALEENELEENEIEENGIEEDELEELLNSVTQDISNTDKSRLKQDGSHTRYSIRARTPKTERTTLLPEPLQVRSRTEASFEHEDQKMTVAEFLRDEAEYERYHPVPQSTDSAQDPGSSRPKKSLFNLKRVASSTFVKDSPGSSKQATGDIPKVPVDPRVTSAEASSSKPGVRSGSVESNFGGLSHVFPPASIPIMRALKAKDNDSKANSSDADYTTVKADEPSPVPPPKSAKRKPVLSVNTAKAADLAKGHVSNSPIFPGGDHTVSASAGTEVQGSFNQAIDTQAVQGAEEAEDWNQSWSEEGSPENALSPTPVKEIERFTNQHPQVKAFERDYLQDAFGVDSTNELLAPKEQQPAKKNRSERRADQRFAKAAAKAAAKAQTQTGSDRRLADKLKESLDLASDKLEKAFPQEAQDDIADAYFKAFPLDDDYPLKDMFPQDVIASASAGNRVPTSTPANTGASTPQRAFGSTKTTGMAVGGRGNVPVRSESQITTAAVTPQRASGDTSDTGATDSGIPSPHGHGSVSLTGDSRINTVATTPHRGSADTNVTGTTVGSSPSPRGHGITSVRRKEVGPGTTKLSSYTDATLTSTLTNLRGPGKDAAGPSHAAVEPNPSQDALVSVSEATATPLNPRDPYEEPGSPSLRVPLEDKAAAAAAEKQLEDDFIAHKVNELRKITGTEIVWYSEDDQRCAHPNHKRTFYSKNLFCGNCRANCKICDAPCCAFKGALQAANIGKGTPYGKMAEELAREIHRYANNNENSTFLECTECYEFVCPDCIGICPIFPCHDQVCKNCKPNQWEVCDFHTTRDLDLTPVLRANAADILKHLQMTRAREREAKKKNK